MTSVKENKLLPPGVVSNLQEVLLSKKGGREGDPNDESTEPSTSTTSKENSLDPPEEEEEEDHSKPILLVTNSDGIESPGLVSLVEALVLEGLYNVYVCAPQLDKSVASHSLTLRETVAATSADINGAKAYEITGTPADCVSLALSGALFSWSKPLLVISGINRGSSCGHQMFYSGVVAGAREALICGVPSISISLNWKKEESQESDFKDAVTVSLPIISAAIRDIEKGVFPKSCSLNVEIPSSPSTNKGYKLTKQSVWRALPSWLAISSNRHPHAGHFMSNQQSLGMQLAQLSRDASAAGAARRLTTQKKIVEIDSVGAAGKPDANRVKKYFRLEFLDKKHEDTDEDLDFKALENGFVTITPLSLLPHIDSDIHAAASDWISCALKGDQ